MTIHNVVHTWNGHFNKRRWMAIFFNKILFSDEAWYVNKQNCHIWGSENTNVIEENQLHQEKSLFIALFGPKV